MDADNNNIFYDAPGWDTNNPKLDYHNHLDDPHFPAPGDLPPPLGLCNAASSFYDDYTAGLRDRLHMGPLLYECVYNTLCYIQEKQGINLRHFLQVLFWGNHEYITDNKIMHE